MRRRISLIFVLILALVALLSEGAFFTWRNPNHLMAGIFIASLLTFPLSIGFGFFAGLIAGTSIIAESKYGLPSGTEYLIRLIMWLLFFGLGWIQWSVIVPYIKQRIRKRNISK